MGIIIEGPNGAGKSVLGEDLSRDLHMEYFHSGIAPKDYDDMLYCIDEQYQKLKTGKIVDRVTCISQRVYNTELDNSTKEFLRDCCMDLLKDHILIYCTANGEVRNKGYYPPNHYKEILETKLDIKERYDRIMKGLNPITFDWNCDSYLALKEKLCKNMTY